MKATRRVDVYLHHVARDTLTPEHLGSHICDGLAAASGFTCEAFSTNSGARCPKAAAVTLPTDDWYVHLCGSHFARHRRGKPVTLPGWESLDATPDMVLP